MQIPTGQLDTLREGTLRILDDLLRVSGDRVALQDPETGLPMLSAAFEQLFEVMARVEGDREVIGLHAPGTETEDITELGEYAFRLHENLAAHIEQAGLTEDRSLLNEQVINFAVWVARLGGQIDTLEPVVDAFAMVANNTSDAGELESLSGIMGKIAGAVSPVIREDLEKINPGRPWRVLLLNNGIVATRSNNPDAMEAAFGILTRHLPEDAARFFTEGMAQMEALNYPPQVRKVMEKYHRQWTVNRSLH
ncbi:MAG: hypothetical protein JSU75_01410 [Gammaproteobacteria bacterium]|nr:MAG: hypothetical protein JSU75_01410 [Gammaproteobacteria bacterium]